MADVFGDPKIFNGSATFNGAVAFNGQFSLPDNVITNAKVIAGAEIAASKLQHRHAIPHSQKNGTDIVSETIVKYIAKTTGSLVRFVVRPTTVPAGGDKAYTIDIQKATNGSGSWTSLITAPVSVSSADTNDVVKAGVLIGSPVYALNDAIRIVITTSGTTGSQGQGVCVQADLDENGA